MGSPNSGRKSGMEGAGRRRDHPIPVWLTSHSRRWWRRRKHTGVIAVKSAASEADCAGTGRTSSAGLLSFHSVVVGDREVPTELRRVCVCACVNSSKCTRGAFQPPICMQTHRRGGR